MEEPKLFYRFINGKLKQSVAQFKENKLVYEDLKEISEVLNKNFQKVFTTESTETREKMRCGKPRLIEKR